MVAFSLFGFSVYWYGIFYFLSFLIGYFLLGFIINKVKDKLSANIYQLFSSKKDDLFFAIILGVMLGGRLGHFLIYYPIELFSNPLTFFEFQQGGMSFIGGIIGVILSLFIFFKKNKLTKDEVWEGLDVVVCLIPIGSLIGRWGNFLNQELYGIPVSESILSNVSTTVYDTLQNIGVFYVYGDVDNVVRLNTNMLASLSEGLLVLIIMQYIFRQKYSKNTKKSLFSNTKPGFIAFVWLFLYSFMRFLLEYWRQDSQAEFVGIFTKSQWFFVVFMVFCAFFIYKKKEVNSDYL